MKGFNSAEEYSLGNITDQNTLLCHIIYN